MNLLYNLIKSEATNMITPNSTIKIGSKVCKNRITMAPTVKFNAGADGIVTDFFVKHYELRATHGCGLICVEATAVAPEGRHSFTDRSVE